MSAPLPLTVSNVSISSLCTLFLFVAGVSTLSAAIFAFTPLGIIGFVIASLCSAIIAAPATAIVGAPLALLATRLLSRSSSVVVHALGASAAGALTGALACLVISPLFEHILSDWGIFPLVASMVLTIITALSSAGGWLIAWVVRVRPAVVRPPRPLAIIVP